MLRQIHIAARALCWRALLCSALSGLANAQVGGAGAFGGFGGPSVLGRSPGASTGQRGGGEMGLRFYAGVTGIYDSGLTGVSLDSTGAVTSKASQGVEGIAGIYGVKRFRRSQVGINYHGSYRQYSNAIGYSGLEQSFAIFATRQLSSKAALGFSAAIGTTNRATGIPILGGVIDSSFSAPALPTAELFDNRLYFGNASVSYSFMKTARLSFGFQGSGFITRRTGGVLFGVNGSSAVAEASYRLSRRQTVTFGYQFFRFDFTRTFGDSIGNGAFLGYNTTVGRRFQLSARGGFYRLEALGLRRVEIDPVIAKLIGFSSTNEVYHGISYIPNGTISFGGPLTRRSSFTLSSGLYVSPGNGVINTSRNFNTSSNYSYTGLRNWSLGIQSGFNRLGSVVGDFQTFTSFSNGGSAGRRLSGSLYLTAVAGHRKFFRSTTNTFQRNSVYASIGVVYSPGEIPLAIR